MTPPPGGPGIAALGNSVGSNTKLGAVGAYVISVRFDGKGDTPGP
jgi:hypothetical protein